MDVLRIGLLGMLVAMPAPSASAVEAWVEVGATAGNRTLVDQNSIQRTETDLRYWEYRELRQAGGKAGSSQPVYGMMIYRSVNCESGESRMQRLVLFNQNREVIRRISYEDSGGRLQPNVSADAAIRHVCAQPPV